MTLNEQKIKTVLIKMYWLIINIKLSKIYQNEKQIK
jgi:hypothetical protein